MKRIGVDCIKDGMILDKDVCGPSGAILLGKGTAISAAMGRRLKNWGIDSICVQGTDSLATSPAQEGLSPAQLRQDLENKFGETLEKPLMKQLFAAVYQFRVNRGF